MHINCSFEGSVELVEAMYIEFKKRYNNINIRLSLEEQRDL